MNRSARRLLLPLLPLVLALACASQTAPPTPSPAATISASPSGAPTLTPSPTPSPSPSAPASPSASPSASASPSVGPSLTPGGYQIDGLISRLDRILAKQRTKYGIPGLSAAVIMPDGRRWSAGAGMAWVERSQLARRTTPFVVGSITKTFVAATVMDLAREGVLGLDDPLSDWLPDYDAPPGVTLRHLLSHTSGIYNYFEHPTYNQRVFKDDPRHVWTPEEIVTEFDGAPYFPAGNGYRYSNTGFVLLGMVIERATGHSLGAELRARFLTPLGLAQTHFQGDGPAPTGSAQGYLISGGTRKLVNDGTGYRPTTSAATVAWAAGAIAASADNLATWADALYGGSLLDPADLAAMTDFSANPYSLGSYGLGTRMRFSGSHDAVGHTGSLRGFAAAMWHFPDENITVVVLSNRGRVDVNPIVDKLALEAFTTAGFGP